MKNLNTMDSFVKGFKIERSGEVFTLTPEEMGVFRYLDKAITGRDCLDIYRDIADEDERRIIDRMMDDELICFNIQDDIEDHVYDVVGEVEHIVIRDYIERNGQ